MSMKSFLKYTVAAAGVAVVATASASAAELQDTDLTYVGSWSSLSLFKNFEKPFWGETLPDDSGGAITVQVSTFDQMGLAGAEVYRLLQKGVFDVGATVADYTVQDAPELEGLDMPMIAPDVQKAWDVAKAYKPVLDDALKERFNAKLVSVVPYPAQVVFCNTEISGLEDLKGKKIRASGRTTAEFLEAIGAEGITMAFNEVPGALERKVIDCAVTGSLSGYSSGWHEVSTHLYPLPVGGWDHVVTAVNLDKWESLDPAVRDFILREAEEKLETPVWEAAFDETKEGVACLTGKGDCARGEAGDMVLVEPTDADYAFAREKLEQDVLPAWAKRVSADWVTRWNETAGKVVGLTANGG